MPLIFGNPNWVPPADVGRPNPWAGTCPCGCWLCRMTAAMVACQLITIPRTLAASHGFARDADYLTKMTGALNKAGPQSDRRGNNPCPKRWRVTPAIRFRIAGVCHSCALAPVSVQKIVMVPCSSHLALFEHDNPVRLSPQWTKVCDVSHRAALPA